jgi:hypothetical protein
MLVPLQDNALTVSLATIAKRVLGSICRLKMIIIYIAEMRFCIKLCCPTYYAALTAEIWRDITHAQMFYDKNIPIWRECLMLNRTPVEPEYSLIKTLIEMCEDLNLHFKLCLQTEADDSQYRDRIVYRNTWPQLSHYNIWTTMWEVMQRTERL